MRTVIPDFKSVRKPESLKQLWGTHDQDSWKAALEQYWTGGLIRPSSMALERDMDRLDLHSLRGLSPPEWYEFLHDRYFRWKYTASNRYATTTKSLRTYLAEGRLAELDKIRRDLFVFNRLDIEAGLQIACRIRGLGVAGASGLLALMFPAYFGTVDQFVVKSLLAVPGLAERRTIGAMKPQGLTTKDGVALIQIMRAKTHQLNELFSTKYWTPRRIDMVLWANRSG